MYYIYCTNAVDGDHDNFTSAMPSSVMGVQLLVPVVMMLLLLLLSGDVETNPGPASKYNHYRYLHACTRMCILSCILSFGVKAIIHAVALMKRSFKEKVDNTSMHACIPFEKRIVEFFKS